MENLPGESEADEESHRLQAEYLDRLRRLLRRAPAEIREDALREVQSHIEDEWRALIAAEPASRPRNEVPPPPLNAAESPGRPRNGVPPSPLDAAVAMRMVLERLGPPEEYGRDLALQLILLNGASSQGNGRRSPAPLSRLVLAAIFWASTSLIGAVVVIGATLVFAYALGMLFTAVSRALGLSVMLIHARNYQFFNYQGEGLVFPPPAWSPVLIGLVGLLPALLVFAGLYRFLTLWVRSRMGQTGLSLVAPGRSPGLISGWERRALLAMLAFAVIGLGGCLLFSLLSELLPIGHPGAVRLPDDFFRTPLSVLAFISGLVFLVSPVLGLLWAAGRKNY